MTSHQTAVPCAACGFTGPAGMRFCGACGQPLLPGVAPPRKPRSRRPRAATTADSVERRHLTVMFCDLADSTRLSGRLDPEDFSRIVLAYRDACVAAVESQQGLVARFVGDGLLIYFGFPVAHEDDPHRAIRAALGVQSRIAVLNHRLTADGAAPLGVRIGIHCGIVLVGNLRTDHHVETSGVMGETPNIAAKLQGLAAPGEIVISDEVRQLAESAFRFHERPPQRISGVERLLRTYAVLSEVPLRDRRDARRHQAPFVGREPDLQALLAAWRSVCASRTCRLAVIEGEAGIGKSRLAQEFRAGIGGVQTIAMQCAADSTASAFYPVSDWLSTFLEFDRATEPRQARMLVEAALAGYGLSHPDLIQAIAVLLGLASEQEQAEAAANPRRKRRRLIEAVTRLIAALAERGPLLLVLEDAHWADNSTLTLLRACLERAASTPSLVLITARGQVLPEVAADPRIVLERLTEADSRSLVRSILGDSIAPAVLAQIVDRTDGVPLFAEEVAWTATGQVTRPVAAETSPQDSIPMTLGHSLLARLDQLAEARPVAQLASVLGRTFRVDFVAALLAEEPATSVMPLPRALDQLAAARFIEAVPAGAPGSCMFRHALIQETAYNSLLRERRQDYHRRIANLLLTRFAETPEARPEAIARHLAAAGRVAEAIKQYGAAAKQAARIAANVEALQHYQAALHLVEQTVVIAERAETEIGLQIGLAAQLVIVRGNAAPEVERALDRAQQLADDIGNDLLRFRARRHLQTFHMVRGDILAAHRISIESRQWALRKADPDILIQVHRPHGLCLLYLGQFAEARAELLRTLELYDAVRHEQHRFDYGSDPAVLARAHMGWVEWFLGRPESGLHYCDAAVTSARALDHPHSLCFALAFRACLAQFTGDAPGAFAAAEELGQVAEAHDYVYWSAWSDILMAWALARTGQRETGERLLREGLADYMATGAGLLRPYCLYLLADCLPITQHAEAITLLDEALAEADARSILFWRAETLRYRADLQRCARRLAEPPVGDGAGTVHRTIARAVGHKPSPATGPRGNRRGRNPAR